MMVVEERDNLVNLHNCGIWKVSHLSRERTPSSSSNRFVIMAATTPTQSQQGVTKTLSGPNAVFKDKVYKFYSGFCVF